MWFYWKSENDNSLKIKAPLKVSLASSKIVNIFRLNFLNSFEDIKFKVAEQSWMLFLIYQINVKMVFLQVSPLTLIY